MTIFFIKDFLSKCDQIRKKMWIWSHLLKLENLIFCAVNLLDFDDYDDGGDYDDDDDRGIAQQHKRRKAQPNFFRIYQN